jgi:hypothetical protein
VVIKAQNTRYFAHICQSGRTGLITVSSQSEKIPRGIIFRVDFDPEVLDDLPAHGYRPTTRNEITHSRFF